jgi:hypothetical protein
MELQPLWRKVSSNKMVRCEDGDPFVLLMARIEDMIMDGAESIVNGLIDTTNDILDSLPWPLSYIGRPIKRVCFPTDYDPDRCKGGHPTPAEVAKLSRCEDSKYGLEEMCYYARVRQICGNEGMLNEYMDLFAQGYKSVDEVEAEFIEAFGESFQYIDPVKTLLKTTLYHPRPCTTDAC